MKIEKLASGPGCEIFALNIKEKCPVQEYISSLEIQDQKKVVALFNRIRQKGPPFNEQKFRYLGDDIYELKTSSRVRILSFFGEIKSHKLLILTHGFHKPKKKQLQREKKKAADWRKEYFQISDKDGETQIKGEKS